MTQEEKAKVYDEALEKARKLRVQNPFDTISQMVEHVFPELKENEDERIKKTLINFHKSTIDIDGIKGENIIAWLKNQGNQKYEWSEEDEKMWALIKKYAHYNISDIVLNTDHITREELVNWLEKQRGNLVENGYTNNKDIIKYANNYSHAIWHKLMDNFKNIKDYHIGCNDVSDIVLNAIIDAYNWFEKQGQTFTKKNESTDTCDSLIIKSKEFPASEKRDFGYFSEPTDKVKPKFHEGDWIVNKDGDVLKVGFVLFNKYGLIYNDGYTSNVGKEFVESNFHLWTINDANDGDVLYSKEHNLLWLHKNSEQCHSCINLNYSNNISIGTDIVIPKDTYPATKKQRDLLFAKMKEAGYEWDAEKKVLKLLITNGSDFIESENCKQNSAWSEEDEKIRKAILNYFIKCWGNCKDDVCGIHVEDVIDWLEKQGEHDDNIITRGDEIIEGIQKWLEKQSDNMLNNQGLKNKNIR